MRMFKDWDEGPDEDGVMWRNKYIEKPLRSIDVMPKDTLFIYKDNLHKILNQSLVQEGYDIEIDHIEISDEGHLCIFRKYKERI